MGEQGIIGFHDVYKSFGENHVLRGINFDVLPGDVHFILGHSGAGKSVLIKQLVGLLKPDSGQIVFDGEDITAYSEKQFTHLRKRCQFVFQHSTLFDSRSVLENIAMPVRKRFGLGRKEANDAAIDALTKVNAEKYVDVLPTQLGHGLRKRIAIARAIALKPEVVLYDEPTTGLDPVNARRTDRLIRDLADRLKITSVVVSHDLISLRSIADRVTFLNGGFVAFEGRAMEFVRNEDPIIHQFVHHAHVGPN